MSIEKICLNPECGKTFVATRSDKRCCCTRCSSRYKWLTRPQKKQPYPLFMFPYIAQFRIDYFSAYAAILYQEGRDNYYKHMNEDPDRVRTIRRNSGRKCRAERPEEHQEKRRIYRANHREQYQLAEARRRAAIANAEINDLTHAQWKEIKKAYAYRCVYCGKKPKMLTLDHITPLSKRGNHTLANIVPACRSCNSAKHAREPLKPVQPMLLTLAQSKSKISLPFGPRSCKSPALDPSTRPPYLGQ